jgi:hypothetical protein
MRAAMSALRLPYHRFRKTTSRICAKEVLMSTRIAAVVGCVGVFATLWPQPLDVRSRHKTERVRHDQHPPLPSVGVA